MSNYARVFIFGATIVAIIVNLFIKYWIWIPALLDYIKYENVLPNMQVKWSTNTKHNYIKDSSNSNRPNIVLILADDLGFNDISFYHGGHHGVSTSNIDSIGTNGIAFTHAYSGRKWRYVLCTYLNVIIYYYML